MANKTLLEKVAEGRQYRAMSFEVRSADENNYIVEGYATTFNSPYCLGENDKIRVMEQVAGRAFDECEMNDVIFQYDHVGRVFARLSNKTMELKADDHGLKVIANLGGTEEGRKLYEEIKGGYTTRMSFGFTIGDETTEQYKSEDGKTEYLRTIKKINKLYDVSAVSLPANDATEISARAYCDGVIADMEKRAKEAEEEAEKKRQEEEARAEEKRKADEKAKRERDALALAMAQAL